MCLRLCVGMCIEMGFVGCSDGCRTASGKYRTGCDYGSNTQLRKIIAPLMVPRVFRYVCSHVRGHAHRHAYVCESSHWYTRSQTLKGFVCVEIFIDIHVDMCVDMCVDMIARRCSQWAKDALVYTSSCSRLTATCACPCVCVSGRVY